MMKGVFLVSADALLILRNTTAQNHQVLETGKERLMKQDIRTGVIGIGSMGKNHARVNNELAALVAVSDVDKTAGKTIARQYGIDYFKDYRELLKNVDAVTIATPTKYHHKIAEDAIEKGVHVLVEKPITETVEQARSLVERARKEELTLAVGHIERHNPVVTYAKKELENDTFGYPITMVSRRVSSFPTRIRDVGVIHDLAIHDVDVMRYLAASEIRSIYTLGGSTGPTEFESHANILLKFASGVNGFAEVNWVTPMKVRKMYLTCSTHYVEMNYIKQRLTFSSSRYMDIDESDLYQPGLDLEQREVSLKKQEPLKNEFKDFLNALNTGKDPLVTGEDAIQVLNVIEKAIKSYKQNKMIEIKTIEV